MTRRISRGNHEPRLDVLSPLLPFHPCSHGVRITSLTSITISLMKTTIARKMPIPLRNWNGRFRTRLPAPTIDADA